MNLAYIIRKNRIKIALGAILLFGLILRLWKLGVGAMWVDETISALVGRTILETGVPVFSSGWFYGRALVFHYLMALFLVFFNNDFGARLVSVVFGLGTVGLAYFVGREFDRKDKWLGIVSALFTAVLFLEVYYSRQARFYQMFQFMFFLTLFLLYKLEVSKNKKEVYAWLSGVSFLVLVNTQIAGIVVAPLVLFVLWKGRMSWKFYVIPILTVLYSVSGILDVSFGGDSAGGHVEEYTGELYSKMRAFLLISIIGIPLAFIRNKKLLFFILAPSIVLFLGLFYVKVYAMRYVYFLVLPVILFFSLAIAELRKLSKIVFVLVVLFALVYPSNLFFEYSYLTQLKPETGVVYSSTEPVIDYKGLSEDTKTLIRGSEVVTLWTSGVSRYLKKPEYFIPFSLNGLKTGYEVHYGVDGYTGARIYDNSSVKGEFVYLEDGFGYGKLNEEERGKVEELKKSCEFVEERLNVGVYLCKG